MCRRSPAPVGATRHSPRKQRRRATMQTRIVLRTDTAVSTSGMPLAESSECAVLWAAKRTMRSVAAPRSAGQPGIDGEEKADGTAGALVADVVAPRSISPPRCRRDRPEDEDDSREADDRRRCSGLRGADPDGGASMSSVASPRRTLITQMRQSQRRSRTRSRSGDGGSPSRQRDGGTSPGDHRPLRRNFHRLSSDLSLPSGQGSSRTLHAKSKQSLTRARTRQ